MLCQACKNKSATIHLTEIHNGHRTEMHLCPDCAQQQGIAVQAQIPINELLSTLLTGVSANNQLKSDDEKACPECGMTLSRFSKESLLGCPRDYQVFEKELLPLIARSHNRKTQHCGKTPQHIPDTQQRELLLGRLRRDLEIAVKTEDYETAARLRDQINQLL